MSMPELTPAAVTILPSITTRSSVGVAPWRASSSRASQYVVARLPSSRPAEPSTSAPVHTDVVHVVVSCAVRSHSSTASSFSACA